MGFQLQMSSVKIGQNVSITGHVGKLDAYSLRGMEGHITGTQTANAVLTAHEEARNVTNGSTGT